MGGAISCLGNRRIFRKKRWNKKPNNEIIIEVEHSNTATNPNVTVIAYDMVDIADLISPCELQLSNPKFFDIRLITPQMEIALHTSTPLTPCSQMKSRNKETKRELIKKLNKEIDENKGQNEDENIEENKEEIETTNYDNDEENDENFPNIYSYYCPICMNYFESILKASCCNNYICLECTVDYLKMKKLKEEEKYEALHSNLFPPDNNNNNNINNNNSSIGSIGYNQYFQDIFLLKTECPHCNTVGFQPEFVQTTEVIRDYSIDIKNQSYGNLYEFYGDEKYENEKFENKNDNEKQNDIDSYENSYEITEISEENRELVNNINKNYVNNLNNSNNNNNTNDEVVNSEKMSNLEKINALNSDSNIHTIDLETLKTNLFKANSKGNVEDNKDCKEKEENEEKKEIVRKYEGVKIGDTFEDLKRKMIPFSTTKKIAQ